MGYVKYSFRISVFSPFNPRARVLNEIPLELNNIFVESATLHDRRKEIENACSRDKKRGAAFNLLSLHAGDTTHI